ncbi:oxygen-independent coproporphyrinogen III oxidase-like protein [Parasulfuritortus cantonensis]|uniref:Heme chaperone HemW n=1 Tax=Parasulfuritortus cantonensis TaxID=2528202 RepID=A0A4V2NV22_9PROT|nr:radical SAM family heme chaperone HemW [Parasulfuritortus cantonensis]TCJ11816.1 oxygen-independent coproporphyrinogen III oxidase-like protein [Parasulfuritortus cantonensis]
MTAAVRVALPGARPAQPAPSRPPPLALYVHVPWCVRKCPYCDFNSHALRGELPEAAYVDALLVDLERALPEIWGRPVETVFVGGGTPSLLSPEVVDRLLAGVRTLLPLRPYAEITLEANPGTFELGRFRAFREAGVTRLSLGIQSFDDRYLEALGRIHAGREAHAAAEAALALFDQVNLDLMYALPGQDGAALARDLAAALAHGPQHLSCYHLTLEPNTAFAAAPPALPDDDTAAAMQEQVEATLAEAGYGHYETSAYARAGQACRHNLNYWLFGDYLGIGAGAHSKLSFPDRVVRRARPRHPKDYLAWAGGGLPAEERVLDADDLRFEFMMNALRLNGGFQEGLFGERTGLAPGTLAAGLAEADRRGLVERDGPTIRPSPLGRRFLNDLLQLFLA